MISLPIEFKTSFRAQTIRDPVRTPADARPIPSVAQVLEPRVFTGGPVNTVLIWPEMSPLVSLSNSFANWVTADSNCRFAASRSASARIYLLGLPFVENVGNEPLIVISTHYPETQ